MGKRRVLLSVVSLILALSLTGCASVPDMSERDSKMISQYAVGLLLKYDAENHSRLVDYQPYVNLYEKALALYKEQEKAYYDNLALEEARREYEKEHNITSSEKDKETPSKTDNNGGATVVDNRSIGDVLDCPAFEFEYAGSVNVDMYPEDADDLSFVITSTSGADLFVTYINVTNTSSEAATLDIMSNESASFKLSVNGGRYTSVLKTFVLEDDLSMYYGDFAAGETKRLALIVEVPDGTVVSTIGLRISTSSGTITKSLK